MPPDRVDKPRDRPQDMPAFATLFLALVACFVLQVSVMAASGAGLGMRVLVFAFGFGPQWLKLGRFHLGVLPLGGYVRFTDEPRDVLSVPAQLLLSLAGVLALLLVSIALIGGAGIVAFVDGFRQLLVGAGSPLGAAQPMLAAARQQALEGSVVATLGLVAAKMAMINAMPWPGTNGGQALAIVGRSLGLATRWRDGWTNALQFLNLVVFVAWLVALAVFVARHGF